MRILEHFDRIVVLDDGSREAGALVSRLVGTGCRPIVVDLAAPQAWRAGLAPAPRADRRRRSTGTLLLAPLQRDDRELWCPQDRMIERLDSENWGIVFLGHGDGARCARDGVRPGLVDRASIPAGLCAIALPDPVLDELAELMPERALDGPLTPTDWLTIAAWLSEPLRQSSRALFAWPALTRPREAFESRSRH
jgi:hypothetical protein